METLGYYLMSAAVFGSIFLFGWQFGCWMVQREQDKNTRDCCTDNFYEDYYADHSLCKNKYNKAKKVKKSNKNSKK